MFRKAVRAAEKLVVASGVTSSGTPYFLAFSSATGDGGVLRVWMTATGFAAMNFSITSSSCSGVSWER